MNSRPNGKAEDCTEPAKRPKPLVHYVRLIHCKLGKSALLIPVDHFSTLVSNQGPVVTSPVQVELGEDGSFETLNTRYEPVLKIKR